MKNVPKFKVEGQLDSVICNINKPLTGTMTVEAADTVIKSIEIQLVRVETCGCAEGYAKEGKISSHPKSHFLLNLHQLQLTCYPASFFWFGCDAS